MFAMNAISNSGNAESVLAGKILFDHYQSFSTELAVITMDFAFQTKQQTVQAWLCFLSHLLRNVCTARIQLFFYYFLYRVAHVSMDFSIDW